VATHIASANGNLTATSTWKDADSTSLSTSESANTAITTSFVASSAFTPGAIAIDGIGIKIASRAASPSGTITVSLFHGVTQDVATQVTVNVSDLPTCTATSGSTTPVGTAEGGWFLFTFASFTLTAATAYTLQIKTSSSSQVNVWSTATTNWSRFLRLNANTGSVTTGDDFIITKEWTAASTGTARSVTMDSTAATDYGNNTTTQVTPALAICQGGTLTCSTGIAAILQLSGYAIVYNGGTLNFGVAGGSEIQRTHSATLQFDCGTDGDFGLVARNGATVSMAGLSRTNGKNVSQTKLNADASAGATSITIVDDTGWLNGDVVCLAPTTQTSTQFESKALTGDATATTAAITALTNAHSGTSPAQAEVGLLTRNVTMKGVTTNVVTFFYVATTASVALSWTSFQYISNNATGKRGIEINTTTGSFSMDFCSIRDADACWWFITGSTASNITITNTVHYNATVATNAAGGIQITATSGTWTVNNCMFCGATSASSTLAILTDIGGTFTNNSISGNTAGANGTLQIGEPGAQLGTFSGLSIHSNAAIGIKFTNAAYGTISGSNIWRNATDGINYNTPATQFLTLQTSNFFGNGGSGVATVTGGSNFGNLILDNCTLNSDTTFTQINGLFIRTLSVPGNIFIYSCQFSVVSGIKTKNTNDIQFDNTVGLIPKIVADSTIFNGTNLYSQISTMGLQPFLAVQNFGQTPNDNRTYFTNGTTTASLIKTNSSTVYSTNPLSEEMQPATASFKLPSESILVATRSGQVATVVVQVQKNGSYNGAAPRLILRRQDSMGVTSDTVKATFSAAANTWQAQTGSSPTAPQDGVYEFIIDCDGTAGSVFVGDTSATVA
jgi:hypothetical protein